MSDILRWKRLEGGLRDAATSLTSNFKIAAVPPYLPSSLGYDQPAQSAEEICRVARAASDWFIVWQGLLAFLIAQVQSRCGDVQRGGVLPPQPHAWLRHLDERQFPQHWLEGLHQSTICNFTQDVPRAGTIVDPTLDDGWLPPIRWFIDYNIPVWFRWAEDTALLVPPEFHPPVQARHISPRLCVPDPTPPTLEEKNPGPIEALATRRAYIQQYISACEERYRSLQNNASPSDLRRWAARLRQPPTTNCRVFVWEAMGRNPTILTRSRVLMSEALSAFSMKQRWYDPVENEWHCCKELAWEDEVELKGKRNITTETLVPSTPRVDESAPDSRPYSPTTAFHEIDILPDCITSLPDLGLNSLLDEMHHTLVDYYGFITPVPYPSGELTRPLTAKNLGHLLRLVGLNPALATESGLGLLAFCEVALSFLESLAKTGAAGNLQWDISPMTVRPAMGPNLMDIVAIKHIGLRSRSGGNHILYFSGRGSAPWRIAVTTASDTLTVCRWGPISSEDCALRLVRRGMRFHTLARAESQFSPSYQRPPPTSIPVRLPGYVFSKADYDAYVHSRSLLLTQPRMRAALMRGGIVWRLAIATMTSTDVLSGPSDAPGLSLVHPRTSEQLIDDELTAVELQIIVGAYLCYTGCGEQVSIRSWWPLPDFFESEDCGENYGRWNQYRETHYQRRQQEIAEGVAQPLGMREWRQRLHGSSLLRKLKSNVERASYNFLQLHVPASGLPHPDPCL
ncbi:hypothetical protein DFP72DRAFT_819930 [Ephemerocybe angulata]|uniref:Uncharacterized protein n=1 Tax=Ephemerocybe angulata TaxID=980116 RepID=A0A8H6HLK3_9AGAR|nr:hypothetical protein DFP72DRAFT_819930 [Tulosesus angulatus]